MKTRSRSIDSAGEAAGSRDGTQAIRRATTILRAIARANNSDGISMPDISRAENLPRSTTHRILKCLVDEGLVEYDAGTRCYQVGGLTYELGLSVSRAALEVGKWRNLIESIARRTGVTSYLMRRSGVEAVCLMKVEGNAVVRVIPVEVGQRRRLGMGAGAMALLAALDDETVERVIAAMGPILKNHPHLDEAGLRKAVRTARVNGFVVSRGVVMEEVCGVGMVIPDSETTPSLAASVAGHVSIATDANIAKWKQIMREEIRAAVSRNTRR
jgi:DNA-binding IclR family transcriptional regulator